MMWQRRIRQAELGTRVGIGQSTLSKKLRGEVPMTVDELVKIAGVLQVNPGDLLPHLDSNQEPSGYASLQVSDVTDLRTWRTERARAGPRQTFPRFAVLDSQEEIDNV